MSRTRAHLDRVTAMAKAHRRKFDEESADHGERIAVQALAMMICGFAPERREELLRTIGLIDRAKDYAARRCARPLKVIEGGRI